MMRIGVLTSSRADFGIYLPLIKKLQADKNFSLDIIAFGTHLSAFHGYTIKEIESAGFKVSYTLESTLLTDSPAAIATAMGLTNIKFADFWKEHKSKFDLIFCLGDRFEMFAAVMAGIPFQIPFAHLHGGETTLGAIDNVFRHAITLASKYHFVSTDEYAQRVRQLINGDVNIHNVGALSLDNLSTLKLLTTAEFEQKWGIDLTKATILLTFHPETVDYEANERYIRELNKAITASLNNYQVLITMPNADTSGNRIREKLIEDFSNSKRVFLIENLGPVSYFTAMKYCKLLLGNTSSGIIEAASYGKYVINVGNRQKGRSSGNNVINIPVDAARITEAITTVEHAKPLTNDNIYFNGGAADKIVNILKAIDKSNE